MLSSNFIIPIQTDQALFDSCKSVVLNLGCMKEPGDSLNVPAPMSELQSDPLRRNLCSWSPDISTFKAYKEIKCAAKIEKHCFRGSEKVLPMSLKTINKNSLRLPLKKYWLWWTIVYLLLLLILECCLIYLVLLFHDYFSFKWHLIRLLFFEFYAPEFPK